jgi:hypothetical protein
MKSSVRKVWQCEHCQKSGLSASAISVHEKYCRSNPANKHKCFEYCRYLLMEKRWLGHIEKTFTCEVTGEDLFSYKREYKARLYPGLKNTKGMMRMPAECKHFKPLTEAEIMEKYDL